METSNNPKRGSSSVWMILLVLLVSAVRCWTLIVLSDEKVAVQQLQQENTVSPIVMTLLYSGTFVFFFPAMNINTVRMHFGMFDKIYFFLITGCYIFVFGTFIFVSVLTLLLNSLMFSVPLYGPLYGTAGVLTAVMMVSLRPLIKRS